MRAERGKSRPIDGAPMPIDQLAEGAGVALPREGNELGIVHTSYRHTALRRGWVVNKPDRGTA